VLRTGSAGSNTAADHIEAARLALAQLPRQLRRKVLVRADSGGGTHGFLQWLTAPSRRLDYSVGMTITEDMQDAILQVSAGSWTPACDGDGQVRNGAWVADITGMPGLSCWSAGMRVIIRKERPHPGAQLRFTDLDGHRFTAFATDARKGQLADLGLRHRRRARCEDRIRNAKDTGLRNLPLQGFAQNQPWCEVVALGCELLAWTQMLARADTARAGNLSACGCACSRSQAASSAAAGVFGSASPNAGPGPTRSPARSPACRPCRRADQPERSLRYGRSNPEARGTQPTRRDNRPASHGRHPKINPSRTAQDSRSRARNVEVNMGMIYSRGV
jgi:Transposase DDE domain group 1